MESEGLKRGGPIFRDTRRYYCKYCGICRSKKTLITSHIFSYHQKEFGVEEVDKEVDEEENCSEGRERTCKECGAKFPKPAYLRQHMLSHSLERPFRCTVDDCHSSYRRNDHLVRHLLTHQGKLFQCPIGSCKQSFTFQGNMNRHVNEFHNEEPEKPDEPLPSPIECQKHACQEIGCGKVFRYASRLRKHQESHVLLDSVEAICCEPDCMKRFSNEECLKAHVRSCHQHVTCEFCGTKQLKKNIKRHLRTHQKAAGGSSERLKCDFEGCQHTFATKSNLQQHVKAVHLELRPFACSVPGCGMRFPFRHVRDNHEKSGCHVHTDGDFLESDERFRSRPRGGRKRDCPSVESLLRKRVTSPSWSDDATTDCWLDIQLDDSQ